MSPCPVLGPGFLFSRQFVDNQPGSIMVDCLVPTVGRTSKKKRTNLRTLGGEGSLHVIRPRSLMGFKVYVSGSRKPKSKWLIS